MLLLKLFKKKQITAMINTAVLVAIDIPKLSNNMHVMCKLGCATVIRHNEHPGRIHLRLMGGASLFVNKDEVYNLGVIHNDELKPIKKSQLEVLFLNVGDLVQYTITSSGNAKIEALESHPKQLLRWYSPDGALERRLAANNLLIVKLK